jgi:hypothetical protein
MDYIDYMELNKENEKKQNKNKLDGLEGLIEMDLGLTLESGGLGLWTCPGLGTKRINE